MANKYIFEDVSPGGNFSPSFIGEAPKRAQQVLPGGDARATKTKSGDNFDTHVTGNIDRLGDGAISLAGTSDPISLKKAAVGGLALASVGIHAALDSRAKDTAWNTLDDAELKPATIHDSMPGYLKDAVATAGDMLKSLDDFESTVAGLHAKVVADWKEKGQTEDEINQLQAATFDVAYGYAATKGNGVSV